MALMAYLVEPPESHRCTGRDEAATARQIRTSGVTDGQGLTPGTSPMYQPANPERGVTITPAQSASSRTRCRRSAYIVVAPRWARGSSQQARTSSTSNPTVFAVCAVVVVAGDLGSIKALDNVPFVHHVAPPLSMMPRWWAYASRGGNRS
jgi:hypothetical protein